MSKCHWQKKKGNCQGLLTIDVTFDHKSSSFDKTEYAGLWLSDWFDIEENRVH